MKIMKSSFAIMFVVLALSACKTQSSENPSTELAISEDIQVYYFHNTARCATCNAVEDETRVALDMFYADEMKAGEMDFTSLNLQEDEGKKMAQTLNVSGQTLLIVKGDKQINLTNEGFMNARTHPTKFHEIIKAQIDQLL